MLTLYILIALIAICLIVINLPVFGSLPKGTRLQKIQSLENYRDGAIQNISPTPMQPEGVSFFTILKAFFFEKHANKIPSKPLEFVRPLIDKEQVSQNPEIIWFGHSSYLIKINGLRVLVDPVFSKSPSPFAFIGSKAFPGTDVIKASDFKNIDVLLITHDHYDHLDYQSILHIAPHSKHIVTSIGVGAHLEKWGISKTKINELIWNEKLQLHNGLAFTALPARHFTGRKFKRNQTAWSSFLLNDDQYKLFLGGDSGYDQHFKSIGEQYGPFDLALLECGQYNAYWPYIHMFPEEVVQAAIDLNTKVLMPVHWGKFSLAMHAWNEPITRVVAEAEKLQFPIITPKLGETVILNQSHPVEKWWEA